MNIALEQGKSYVKKKEVEQKLNILKKEKVKDLNCRVIKYQKP